MKKTYTREDKIKYYTRKVMNLEYALEKARERLDYLNSEEYQDWNGELAVELANKKLAKARKGA